MGQWVYTAQTMGWRMYTAQTMGRQVYTTQTIGRCVYTAQTMGRGMYTVQTIGRWTDHGIARLHAAWTMAGAASVHCPVQVAVQAYTARTMEQCAHTLRSSWGGACRLNQVLANDDRYGQDWGRGVTGGCLGLH